MPFKIREKVDGLQECLASLAGLKEAIRRRITRKAVAAAGKVILRAMKAAAPKETGLLRKSLGRKVKVYRNSGVAVAVVGPRVGFRQEAMRKRGKWLPTKAVANPVKYAHLVELGTARGKAQPFMRLAIMGQRGAILAAVAEEVKKGLEAEAAKAAKGR